MRRRTKASWTLFAQEAELMFGSLSISGSGENPFLARMLGAALLQ